MPSQIAREMRAKPVDTTQVTNAWDIRLAAVVIPVIALLVFAPSLGNGWVGWDDEAYITTSPLMTEPGGLTRIWASSEAEQYYPLTFTTFWIEYQLWERAPAGYHATNVVFHALNTLLLLFFLRALGAERWTAIVVTLLFAVHPLQTMSVAWVAQRKNLLSGFFCLFAFLAWVHFRRNDRERWYFGSLAAFMAALLSKTAVLTFPLAVAAMDRFVLKRPWRSTIGRVLPMLMLSAAAVLVTQSFEDRFLVEEPEGAPPWPIRPLIAAAGLWFYVGKLVWPADLLPLYPRWNISISAWAWWIPMVALIAAGVAVSQVRGRLSGMVLFGLLYFVVFLLPMLGLFAYGNLALTYVSDHYVYLPCIGLFLSVGVGVERAVRPSQRGGTAVTGILGVVALAACVTTVRYIPVFKDAGAMWTRTLAGNPDCYTAHAGLGQYYARQKNWAHSVAHYGRAIELRPRAHAVRLALGQAQTEQGDLAAAEVTLTQAAGSSPDQVEPVLGLAFIAERTGRIERAIELYEQAVQSAPDDGEIRVRLGKAYLGVSRIEQAAKHFRTAMAQSPGDPWTYLGLATCRRGAGHGAEAVRTLEEGLTACPGNISLLNLLARILATDPDDQVRDGPRAVELAQQACAATRYQGCLSVDTLAAAYAEVGDYRQAATMAERAARIAESRGHHSTARAIRASAAQYRNNDPQREITTNLTLE